MVCLTVEVFASLSKKDFDLQEFSDPVTQTVSMGPKRRRVPRCYLCANRFRLRLTFSDTMVCHPPFNTMSVFSSRMKIWPYVRRIGRCSEIHQMLVGDPPRCMHYHCSFIISFKELLVCQTCMTRRTFLQPHIRWKRAVRFDHDAIPQRFRD